MVGQRLSDIWAEIDSVHFLAHQLSNQANRVGDRLVFEALSTKLVRIRDAIRDLQLENRNSFAESGPTDTSNMTATEAAQTHNYTLVIGGTPAQVAAAVKGTKAKRHQKKK